MTGNKTIFDALDLLVQQKGKYENPTIYLWSGFKKELNALSEYQGIKVFYINVMAKNKMMIGEYCFID